MMFAAASGDSDEAEGLAHADLSAVIVAKYIDDTNGDVDATAATDHVQLLGCQFADLTLTH